jgi:leucyl-tRNA synthetase
MVFRTTSYADELYDGIDKLTQWPEHNKEATEKLDRKKAMVQR